MDEKMTILKMLEEGKINAEEAARLIEAVGVKKEKEEEIKEIRKKKAKYLRINVDDPGKNEKVRIKIPMNLVKAGMKMGNAGIKIGKKFNSDLAGLEDLDLSELEKALSESEGGKLIDIESEDGSKVQIELEE